MLFNVLLISAQNSLDYFSYRTVCYDINFGHRLPLSTGVVIVSHMSSNLSIGLSLRPSQCYPRIYNGFQILAWNWMGWQTVPWNKFLLKIDKLGKFCVFLGIEKFSMILDDGGVIHTTRKENLIMHLLMSISRGWCRSLGILFKLPVFGINCRL